MERNTCTCQVKESKKKGEWDSKKVRGKFGYRDCRKMGNA